MAPKITFYNHSDNHRQNFFTSLKFIANLKIPLCILTESFEKTFISEYADASLSEYGDSVYMQSKMGNGTTVKLNAKVK